MIRFVGLDVSQKITAICVVDDTGRRLWRGQCPTNPEQISILVRRHVEDDARIGIETGAMTPWLVHELRNLGLEVVCLDARHARDALKMQINKTDQNDAEGLAQIVRTGWYRAVHVKSFESHRARAFLGARAQLVGMTTGLSNHIRGVLKTFGLLPGSMRGLPFDRKVEALLLDRSDVALIVRPMLVAWRWRNFMINFRKTIALGLAAASLGMGVAATSTPVAAWDFQFKRLCRLSCNHARLPH
jgi:transposase